MPRLIIFAALVVVSSFISSEARAQSFILDSGVPATTTYPIMNNADWFAGEFSATAGETVTDLSVYMHSIASGNGNNFAFVIYTDDNGAFLTTRNANLSGNGLVELTATGTFTAAGWNTSTVDWTVPTTGNYWLAVEGNTPGTRNLPNYDLVQETGTATGTVPALAFAYDSGTQFSTSTGVPIGLEVTVAAVPEPASWALGVVAVGVLVFLRRRAF
jgi:MYXO-CTERM domain-containing protein